MAQSFMPQQPHASLIGTNKRAFLLHDVFNTCHSLIVFLLEACCEPEALLGVRPVGVNLWGGHPMKHLVL